MVYLCFCVFELFFDIGEVVGRGKWWRLGSNGYNEHVERFFEGDSDRDREAGRSDFFV